MVQGSSEEEGTTLTHLEIRYAARKAALDIAQALNVTVTGELYEELQETIKGFIKQQDISISRRR